MQAASTIQHSRKHRVVLWMLALLVITGGSYLSHIRFLDDEWLSRAGCLVVVLGIWSGLGGIIEERVLLSRLHLRRRLVVARTRRTLRARKADGETIAAEVDKIAKQFEEKSEVLSDALRFSLGVLEVSLLITGTLIWGFGDLVNYAH